MTENFSFNYEVVLRVSAEMLILFFDCFVQWACITQNRSNTFIKSYRLSLLVPNLHSYANESLLQFKRKQQQQQNTLNSVRKHFYTLLKKGFALSWAFAFANGTITLNIVRILSASYFMDAALFQISWYLKQSIAHSVFI